MDLELVRQGAGVRAWHRRGSALDDLLRNSVDYEPAGAPIPRKLLAYGFGGSAAMIACGLLGFWLSDSPTIRSGRFLIVGASLAVHLVQLLAAAALPLVLAGCLLLGLDLILARGPRVALWRPVIVAQAGAGGLASAVPLTLLALFVLTVVIVVLFAVAMIALLLGALFASGGGS